MHFLALSKLLLVALTPALVDQALLARYLNVVLLNRDPMRWSKQREYGGDFPYMRYWLRDAEIRQMLEHRFWLACREPSHGYIDRIAIDLDAKSPEKVSARDERYARLRALFGEHHVPLVYRTPSGSGLRVVYRIPRTRRASLLQDLTSGVIPDVLRAGGLAPMDSEVELFPQDLRPDRLPLGRRMPLLDPVTLIPIPHANIGDAFDHGMLEGGIAAMEAWHAKPLETLIGHLRSLPTARITPRPLTSASTSSVATTSSESASAELPELSVAVLTTMGLSVKGSRRRAEWIIGSAFIADPGNHPEYELTSEPGKREIARAIALWLSRFHNGMSEDWNRELRRVGSSDEAVEVFTENYLLADGRTGQSFIDRLYARRAKNDPGYRRTIGLSGRERDGVLTLAERHFGANSSRYRFECWMFAFLMSVKRIVYRSSRNGPLRQSTMDLSGVKRVRVQLPTNMLRGWPYGAGRGKSGKIRYREYLDILTNEGVVKLAKYYRTANVSPSGKGEASWYGIRPPNLNVFVREVGIHRDDLKRAIEGLEGYGGAPLTIYEAYHTLHVLDAVPDLASRYGRPTASRIERYGRHVHRWLEEHPDIAA